MSRTVPVDESDEVPDEVVAEAAAEPEPFVDPRPIRDRVGEIFHANVVKLPAKRTKYDPEIIDRVLLELAICGGRVQATVRRLEDVGITGIAEQTIRTWQRVTHADRYAELAESSAKMLEKKIAAEAEAYIMRAAEIELRILNKIAARCEREEADMVTLSNALRNVSVSKGITMDKVASPIRGRPTVIQGSPDNFDQLLGRLARLGLQLQGPETVDGTAQELPPGGGDAESAGSSE